MDGELGLSAATDGGTAELHLDEVVARRSGHPAMLAAIGAAGRPGRRARRRLRLPVQAR
jgi:hypothetical protein